MLPYFNIVCTKQIMLLLLTADTLFLIKLCMCMTQVKIHAHKQIDK